jgi:pyridoxal phosphate enzyme (YggS family)
MSQTHVADGDAGLSGRLDAVRARVEAAAAMAGRPSAQVTLVAISKFHDAELICNALRMGHRAFGESRVQEAARKWPALKADYPDAELHLVGQLQTNKVRSAVELFDFIHTVDRPRLAKELGAEMARVGRYPACLIQVNTGAELQKGGVAVGDLDPLLHACQQDYGLPIRGLMCIPPVEVDPAPHFQTLRDLADRHALPVLSMGMSADYELAIAHGATHVRVGQGIFGPRTA